MKLLLLALSTLVVDLSFAEVCKTKEGEVCSIGHKGISKMNLKSDPCFKFTKFNKESTCFYDDNNYKVKYCDCSIAACNCVQDASEDGSSTDSLPDYSSSKCGSEKTTYCKLEDKNTMCKYCGVDEANCGSPITRNITDDSEKAAIVDRHNDLRRKVAKGEEKQGSSKVADGERAQPAASNMNELVWDDEVAKMAQTWTDQCSKSAHDSNRKMAGGDCGQNVYNSWSSEKSSSKALARAVQSWYDEVKDFDNSAVESYDSEDGKHTGKIGHYTQVVWADVTKIGCGYMYRVDASLNNWYKETVICNYCKAGNMIGKAMYKKGAPASDCPDDHPNADDGLCKK